jgi:hypothetical protein
LNGSLTARDIEIMDYSVAPDYEVTIRQ